jgi:hypothetical protein
VQQLHAGLRAHRLEDLEHPAEVVAVEDPEVAEAQRVEHLARHDHVLQVVGDGVHGLVEALADARDPGDEVLELLGGAHRRGVGPRQPDLREHARERADRLADRLLVVVQDDQQIAVEVAGGVRLERHARHDARVADHRDGALLSPAARSLRQARAPSRSPCRRGRSSSVVGRLVLVREVADAALLAQRKGRKRPVSSLCG